MRISDWSSDVCSSDFVRPSVEEEPYDHPEPEGHRGQSLWGRKQRSRIRCVGGGHGELSGSVEDRRASWRERVGQYVEISVGAGALKKKKRNTNSNPAHHHDNAKTQPIRDVKNK